MIKQTLFTAASTKIDRSNIDKTMLLVSPSALLKFGGPRHALNSRNNGSTRLFSFSMFLLLCCSSYVLSNICHGSCHFECHDFNRLWKRPRGQISAAREFFLHRITVHNVDTFGSRTIC